MGDEEVAEGVRYDKDHKIDLGQLTKLKRVFEITDEDGSGELEEQEFVKAVSPVLCNQMTERELQQLFLRVDANANGSVDWDEFSSYILLSGEHKLQEDTMNGLYVKQTEHSKIPARAGAFRDPDHHVGYTTCLLCNKRNGKYYTCGRDGVVKAWSSVTQQLEQTVYQGGSWITDAVFLRNDTRLAICSMDKVVTVFDVTQNKGTIWKAFVGKKHAWGKEEKSIGEDNVRTTAHDMTKLISAGDTDLDTYTREVQKVASGGRERQYVEMSVLHELEDTPMCISDWGPYMCLGLKSGHLQLYDPTATMNGSPCLVPCEATFSLHTAPISKVKTAAYVDGVITAGWDKTIKIVSLERGKVTRVLGDSAQQKSIFSLDWSESHRLLASAAAERHILLWNPYISKPVYRLDGHHQPLANICFNPEQSQLISLSLDKAIKVWDLRTMRCLQTITNEEMNFKIEDTVTTLAYDATRSSIVCAASYPCSFRVKGTLTEFPTEPKYTGHHEPVVGCIFNPLFTQVISSDKSRVMVWDALTGRRLNAFYPHHNTGLNTDNQTVALNIDENGRRLILASHTGVTAFNYANGQVLKEFDVRTQSGEPIVHTRGKEIAAAAYVHDKEKYSKHILAGIGSLVLLWEDKPGNARNEKRVRYHTDISGLFESRKGDSTIAITCITLMTSGHSALGTDKSIVLLYNYHRNEVASHMIGDYTPGVNIEGVHYQQEREALLIAADNVIKVWSVRLKTVVFNLSHGKVYAGKVIPAVASSQGGKVVIAGDECGVLYVWEIDIKAYLVPECDQPAARTKNDSPTDVAATTGDATLKRVFRAHSNAVSTVFMTRVRDLHVVITSASDCQVKLFTLTGCCIGTFGCGPLWNIEDSSTWLRVTPATPFSFSGSDGSASGASLGWAVMLGKKKLEVNANVTEMLRRVLRKAQQKIVRGTMKSPNVRRVYKGKVAKPRVQMGKAMSCNTLIPLKVPITVSGTMTPSPPIPSKGSHRPQFKGRPAIEERSVEMNTQTVPSLPPLDLGRGARQIADRTNKHGSWSFPLRATAKLRCPDPMVVEAPKMKQLETLPLPVL